jgi:hypothetical protein
MQFPSENLISFTVMGLWVYALRVRKTTCNPHCIFGTSNYKLWWMFSDLQFLGYLATDDDSSWATDTRTTMQQRDAREERNHLERRLMSWIPMNILMLLLFCCVSGWYGGPGWYPGWYGKGHVLISMEQRDTTLDKINIKGYTSHLCKSFI